MSASVTSDNSDFIDPEAGLGFRSLVSHFRMQSGGDMSAHPGLLLPNSALSKRKNGCSKVRIIKLTSKTEGDEGKPKLEIVDPNEAINRRAASELMRETQADKAATQSAVNSQKQVAARRVNTSQKRRVTNTTTTTAAAKSKVKRARDIFDV